MTAGEMRKALEDSGDDVEIRVYQNGDCWGLGFRDAEFDIDGVDWDRQDSVLLIQVSKERKPREVAA